MHIRLLGTILCALLVTVPLVSVANAAIEVWAVNDSVRIDPIRNQPFEDNQDLFPDGIRPAYKRSNLIWDGTARRITLKAARNETVAFQIVIERRGEKLSNVMVKAILHGSIDDKASLGAPGMWVHDPDEWGCLHVKFGEAIEKIRGLPAEVR